MLGAAILRIASEYSLLYIKGEYWIALNLELLWWYIFGNPFTNYYHVIKLAANSDCFFVLIIYFNKNDSIIFSITKLLKSYLIH